MPDVLIVFFALIGLGLLVAAGYVGYALYRKVLAERAAPPRGSFTTISTGRLHYLDCGTGPAIVLVHGLDGNMGHFDCGLIDDLARDFRVIAIDRPGSGYSERASDVRANLRTQARHVAEVIEKLDIDNPLLVGHSLGGAISLALAVERPEMVCGLALLAPLTLPTDNVPDVFSKYDTGTDIFRRIVAWTVGVPNMLRHPEPVVQQVFGPDRVPPEFFIRGGGILSLRPNALYNASRDFMASTEDLPGLARDYARLSVPVRILYGRDDRILDPGHHGDELVHRYPQIALRTTPGGHMLPVTHPAECAAFIRKAAEAMKGRKFISRASPEVYR